MTTIGPQKRKMQMKLVTFGFLAVFAIGAFLGIPLYADIVNLKHDIRDAEKRVASLEVRNAEVKNEFYELIDAERLEKLATDLGLVFEKNPSYIEIKPHDLATTL
jgi:cell division protein FtsL